MTTYRLGVASMVHDHVWSELRHWSQFLNVQIVAAGDANPPLCEKIQAEYGVSALYEDPVEMINKEELDLVQAGSANAKAADIVEAAAAKGVHVISEKPMSARLSEADRMLKAIEQSGTKLLINWPNIWSPAFQTMDRMVTEGAVGEPFTIKYRAAHNGPKEIGCSEYFWKWLYDEELNGAGALMDYCCYGASMCAHWLGRARSCMGVRGVLVKDYAVPDDNAMILAKYDNAFGVCEASWTQRVGSLGPNPVVYGTEGAIGLEGGQLKLWKPGSTPKAIEPQVIEPDDVPEGFRNGPEHLIYCIENDCEPKGIANAVTSRNAQEILEAGLVSARTGAEASIPLRSG